PDPSVAPFEKGSPDLRSPRFAVTPFQVRPLVIVRGHADGLFSACPAFAPAMVTHAASRETALEDLAWFLEEFFVALDADAVQKFIVPEEATLRHVKVVVPRDDLPRGERMTAPLTMPAIELDAALSAKWVLLPTLHHVAYVPAESVSKLDETVEKE